MEQPNYFAILPANVRYCKALSPNAKILFAEITALSNKDGYCFASNKYFAELYDVTTRAIQIWIESLSVNGFVRVELDEPTRSKRKIWPLFDAMGTPHENLFIPPMKKYSGGEGEKIFTHNIPKVTRGNNKVPKGTNRHAQEKEKSLIYLDNGPKLTKYEKVTNILNLYPKQTAIPKARPAIGRVIDKGDYEKALTAVTLLNEMYKNQPITYLWDCHTFFNDERYNDDPETWKPKTFKSNGKPVDTGERNYDSWNQKP